MATGQAIVCKIKNHIPISNRDFIVTTNIFGENVIINKNTTPIGTRGILIDSESVIDGILCKNLNLFRNQDLNLDTNKKGYVDDKGRVRCEKFAGVLSTGLFLSFDELENVGLDGISTLKDGYQLQEYNGHKICQKYLPPVRQLNRNQTRQQLKKNICPTFKEHTDTLQLMRSLNNLSPGAVLTTTVKLHGCSMRCGFLPVENKSLLRRFLNWAFKINKFDYRFIVGSRHVVKYIDGVDIEKQNSYYDSDIWTKAAKDNFYNLLHKGETIYCELVGYQNDDTTIMPSQPNNRLKNFFDKNAYNEFIKKYGETTHFTYGCNKGQYKLFVYRITHTNEDGISIDLTWPQVKQRCKELGVDHVKELRTEIYRPWEIKPGDYGAYPIKSEEELLSKHFQKLTDMSDDSFPNQVHEGIVVRMDYDNNTPKFMKNKYWVFKVLEQIIKDNPNNIDTEETN